MLNNHLHHHRRHQNTIKVLLHHLPHLQQLNIQQEMIKMG
jgi:hypothetical protein